VRRPEARSRRGPGVRVLTANSDELPAVRSGLPRSVEVLLSGAGLVVAAPIIGVAGALVALTSGLPVLFRQTRIGRGGRPFTLVKLRTMRARRGLPVTAGDDARVTAIGRILRRSKLDELPELWNVLRGDMSFVGPRPEVPEYVDFDNPVWREVFLARPGLTDPVTLRFRNEEKLLEGVEGDRDAFYRQTLQPLKLDGYREYLRRRTWRSDVGVLLETIVAILWPARSGTPKASEMSAKNRVRS
jgi:lipopolysaccharide/colanic/teichoic acid biosynthesis glycosyltransferase